MVSMHQLLSEVRGLNPWLSVMGTIHFLVNVLNFSDLTKTGLTQLPTHPVKEK